MTKQLSLALRDGGTVYVYGALSGDSIQVDPLDMLYKYKKIEVLEPAYCCSACVELITLSMTRPLQPRQIMIDSDGLFKSDCAVLSIL